MIVYEKLPETLLTNISFEKIYSLREDKKSSIILFDKTTGDFKNRQIFRSYMSYLNTPDFNPNIKKSYMFLNKSTEVPEIFNEILNYIKSIDSRYNQMVVNYYEPDEYIEAHRDCSSSMISENAPILMINLNETDSIYDMRTFHTISVDKGEYTSVPLFNGYIYKILNNKTHRHFTGKGGEKRISLTFRMMKEANV
ncbi:MAG TPA: hypothetical protein VFQ56_03900 [Flavobacterium sp.]|nr:hypothetical protein [Flavobacterium sp.]